MVIHQRSSHHIDEIYIYISTVFNEISKADKDSYVAHPCSDRMFLGWIATNRQARSTFLAKYPSISHIGFALILIVFYFQ